MRLVITGGAGFIGSHFLELSLKENSIEERFKEILVVDKLTYAGNRAYLELLQSRYVFQFVEQDISDAVSMSKIIRKGDSIVNFAAESHVDNSLDNSLQFVQSNVLGTSVLLELSKNKEIDKFVQISTDEVYGSITQGKWDEKCNLNPNSPYSASKASADLIALSFFRSHKIPVVITRSSNNYGPRQDLEKFMPKVITNILKSKEIPVYGNGNNIRDWIYVEDNVLAIWSVLLNGIAGEVYNIGGGNELSNIELINKIGLAMKRNAKTIFVQDRKAHDFRYSVCTSKIESSIGFFPTTDLDCGIEKTIRYFLERDRI